MASADQSEPETNDRPRSEGAARRRAAIALLLLVPVPSIGTTMAMWVAPGVLGKTVYFLSKCWILALPIAWLLFVERRRFSWSPIIRSGLATGAATGVAIGLGILGAYWFFWHGKIDATPLFELAAKNGFDRPAVYLAFAAYLTLVNSLLEEYVWRWFVFRKCETLAPGGFAVVASALFFTMHHVVALRSYLPWGPTILASAGVFVGGVLWGWMYLRYRSVWPGYASHALIDAVVFVVGWSILFGKPA